MLGMGREGIFPFPPRKIAQDQVKEKLEIPDHMQSKGEIVRGVWKFIPLRED
jgi:hypothetical protein